MKKYLMTGIAALALCAGFTSCSHDLEPMSQDEIDQMEAQKVVNTYKAAFENYIGGKVAANQTWGFSGTFSTRTRGNASTNANMWADYGYDVPVELTPAQITRVVAYFQHNKLTAGGSKDWTDYFVQQVYKGGSSPIGNKTTPNGYSPEEYQCANGEWITGSSKMDYLTACSGDHINNFNYGRYSSEDANNTNGKPNDMVKNSEGVTYLNAGREAGYHSDWIQLMVGEEGAKDFGYGNSQANKTYYDHYVLVDGSVIDEWASRQNPVPGASVSGRAFVGFDFEQFFKDEDVYVGSWTFKNEEYKYVVNAPNKYCGDIKTFDDTNKPTALGDDEIQKWLDDGYLPVDGNDKAWARVAQCADGYFSDWIVCIAPGHKIIEKNADLRVMAEDLTLGSTDEDFDFNDIVFDVYFGEANAAKVVVKAAGGTLPLRIARVQNPSNNNDADWSEVHDLFASVNSGVNCANKMINTHGTDADQSANVQRQSLDGLTCPEFTLPFAVKQNADAKNIIIQVYKGGQWVEITSEQGEPAAKFAVPHTYGWMKERTSIKSVNESFTEWCQGKSELIWVGGINE